MTILHICDPFADARPQKMVATDIDGEPVVMFLDWRSVREAARDWALFSSDAPFRVPIPSEEDVRSVRQLPIETDPPRHTEIRTLLSKWFRRPHQKAYLHQLDRLISEILASVIGEFDIDVIHAFALPIQSKALALLLNVALSEADTWIGWGTHVFRDGADPVANGQALDDYLRKKIAVARASNSGEDFFFALTQMQVNGRALSDEEILGITNLTFAGGRDTLINSISALLVWAASNRSLLNEIAKEQHRTALLVEEILRVVSPLGHIGRVCSKASRYAGHELMQDQRASLCWAAANRDPEIFSAPCELIPDRTPNPHLAFGSGHHTCLGAPQARAILRSLIVRLSEQTSEITITECTQDAELLGPFSRPGGFASLGATLSAAS